MSTHRGFTLLELLVVLVIIGLLAGVVGRMRSTNPVLTSAFCAGGGSA